MNPSASMVNLPYVNPTTPTTPVKIGKRSNTANESRSSGKLPNSTQDKHPASRCNRGEKQQPDDGRSLQIEEGRQEDEYSVKHVAAARYLRNHQLINEVFGDTILPDVRNVVTAQRINALERQILKFTMDQSRVEAELRQIEERFQAKKRRFVESSERFEKEIKKHCPVVSVEYEKMVEQEIEVQLDQQNQSDWR